MRGGGAKPWRQKGTGRARAGTIRSPLWRGGGVTFAAKPRDFTQKVNRKMYRGAFCMMLSELIRQDRLMVTDTITSTGKTGDLVKKLKQLELDRVLLVTDQFDLNLYLAIRNLPKAAACEPEDLDPLALAVFDKLLFTEGALKKLEEKLLP